MDIPIHDPWFVVFVIWNVFSAIVSGMPEPELHSSLGYIWLYRSFHILSSQGTAYFMHKNQWGAISGPRPDSGLPHVEMLP